MKFKGFFVFISTIICLFLGIIFTGSITQAATVDSSQLPVDNNEKSDLGIKIDGNFDDWKDKTKHAMTIKGDDDNIKYVSFLTDGKNIYLYVLMNPKLSGGYTNFQPDGYTLTVGDKVFYISFNNHQTVTLNLNQKKAVSMNIYASDDLNVNLNNNAYVSRQTINQKNGDGSDYKGTGYVFEASIPLDKLKGVSDTSGQTIKLANNNLWTGSLEASGGSTGPIVLASVGFTIAIISVLKITGFGFKKRG